MPHPSLTISRAGEISRMEDPAREMFAKHPGVYRALRAGSVLILALDEGTGAAPQDGETLALAGDLNSMALLGLLNILGQGRETGRLVIKREQIERVIMIRDGDVASVGSNAPHDRLGRFLVRLGKVTESALEEAVQEASATGRRIGQVLLGRGLLDAHELWSTIQAQITDIFADVVSWDEGSFVLYRLPEEHRFPSTPPLSMQGLLLEAVRRSDEMSVFREHIPNRNVRLERTAVAMPDDLDEVSHLCCEAIRGGRSVVELSQVVHRSEFDVTRSCHTLLERGLIRVTDELGGTGGEPSALGPEEAAKIEVFNLAFREIRDEIVRAGSLENFIVGVQKYLQDATGTHAPVFHQVQPDVTGALPAAVLMKNVARLQLPDPWLTVSEALNDLTFFMLFQCGELLDPSSDENLARRVRLIHAALRTG